MPSRLLALASLLAVALLPAAAGAQALGPSPNLLRATAGIPVFLPVNAAGNPLLSTPPGDAKPVVALFLRRTMADSFVAGVRRARTDVGGTLKVQVVPLADLLRSQPPDRSFELAFVADPAEVGHAGRELTAQGKAASPQGVPIFLLRSPTQGYVTITVGGRSVIPAFLGFTEVAALREQMRSAPGTAPAAAGAVIEVGTLEALLGGLQSSPDPMFKDILLQPSGAAVAETR